MQLGNQRATQSTVHRSNHVHATDTSTTACDECNNLTQQYDSEEPDSVPLLTVRVVKSASHLAMVNKNDSTLRKKSSAEVNTVSSERFGVSPSVNGVTVNMDIDTCAEASIVSSAVWDALNRPVLKPAPRLRAYGGGEVAALGQCLVNVEYEGQRRRLPLVFVKSARERGLFGIPWINAFNAVKVNEVEEEFRLGAILSEFADVFEPATGCIKGHRGHLYLKPEPRFKMNKPRPVPFA